MLPAAASHLSVVAWGAFHVASANGAAAAQAVGSPGEAASVVLHSKAGHSILQIPHFYSQVARHATHQQPCRVAEGATAGVGRWYNLSANTFQYTNTLSKPL